MSAHGRWIMLIILVCPRIATGQIRRPGEWTRSDSTLITTYQNQLRAMLRSLKNDQHTYRQSHRTYAPSTEYLNDPLSHGTVYILEATESGWSAVAFHDHAPGFRCYIREGNARPLTGRVEHANEPGCFGGAVALLVNPPDSLLSIVIAERMAQPPKQRDCHAAENQVRDGRLNRIDQFERYQGYEGRATLRFVIGTDGEIEPSDITILETSSSLAALDALVLVVNCGYHPGIVNGFPVRVIVQQQINFANR